MAATFELKRKSDDQFMFNLRAANGEVILTSERYTTKRSAETGIASVQANAGLDERYDRRTSSSGQPHFVLRAANHEIIGTSEMYSSAAAMENGIDSVKRNGPDAGISDRT